MNVLIVDDNPTNLALLSHMLAPLPDVQAVQQGDPAAALDWCRNHEPDAVLLDYMMPGMDGLQFLDDFRALPGKANVPVIMITADQQTALRHEALQSSANDFLTKPVDHVELRARLSNMLAARRSQLALAQEVRGIQAKLAAREAETVHRLSLAAKCRDPETGAHLLRMANYARLIAAGLGLPQNEQNLILAAAPMHDIGKVGIPDNILLKPGRLDPDELAVMRRHPEIGARILGNGSSALLQAASSIALHHHERFDGTGYPHGLAGEQIPLYARIVAVADVFDALTSSRPYKPAWPLERALAHLREHSGTHFDPRCVQAFLTQWDAVSSIHQQYPDDDL